MFEFRDTLGRVLGALRAGRLGAALRLVGWFVAIGIVVAVAWTAARGIVLSQLRLSLLGLAILPALLYWFGLGRAWVDLVGGRAHFSTMSMWTRTQVLRYLPGRVWAIAARATMVEGRVQRKASLVLIEAGTTLAVAVAIGGAAAGLGWPGRRDWALLVLIPVALLVANAGLGRRSAVPTGRLSSATARYAVSWIAYGTTAVLCQAAVGPVPASYWQLVGAACLAWAAGFVVIFLPSGLGAREGAYVALLAGVMPVSSLAAAALLTRLLTIAAELIVLAVMAIAATRARSSSPVTPSEPGSTPPLALMTGRVSRPRGTMSMRSHILEARAMPVATPPQAPSTTKGTFGDRARD